MAVKSTPHIARRLDLAAILKRKSCFLFGPRQTGKTWLIRETLSSYRTYNLLEHDVYAKLSRQPERLRQECQPDDEIVIIDEIQKLPALLDEVQWLIEERRLRFLLTGSSARKLRRGGVNLLGGRALLKQLHPFVFSELGERFDLMRAVNNGLLPSIYFSENPDEALEAYVGAYLKEEIAAEGLTRNLPAYGRFLEVAGLCSGQLINYTKISNDAQVARTTIQEYFEILKDTLLASELPPWLKTKKRKPISTSKLYLFDSGVARFLQNRNPVKAGSPEFGQLFEHYIYHELRSYSDYMGVKPLCYWRSMSGFEVDFILGDSMAIEVKATPNVGPHDLKGLSALQQENKLKKYIVISLEKNRRQIGSISIWPWREFLGALWGGEFRL